MSKKPSKKSSAASNRAAPARKSQSKAAPKKKVSPKRSKPNARKPTAKAKKPEKLVRKVAVAPRKKKKASLSRKAAQVKRATEILHSSLQTEEAPLNLKGLTSTAIAAVAGEEAAEKIVPGVSATSKDPTSSASEPETDIPEQTQAPLRSHPRKVICTGNSVVLASTPIGGSSGAVSQEASSAESQSQPEPITRPKPAPEQVLPKWPWDALPANAPAQIKFLIASAKKECEQAQTWPFPYAKFIASLPQELCGFGLGSLFLRRDHTEEEVAKICGIDLPQAQAVIRNTRFDLENLFASRCGEIYRKWNLQLGGAGKGIDAILEPYFVSKVDRNFQKMIAEVILESMGAENPVEEGRLLRTKWCVHHRPVN